MAVAAMHALVDFLISFPTRVYRCSPVALFPADPRNSRVYRWPCARFQCDCFHLHRPYVGGKAINSYAIPLRRTASRFSVFVQSW